MREQVFYEMIEEIRKEHNTLECLLFSILRISLGRLLIGSVVKLEGEKPLQTIAKINR